MQPVGKKGAKQNNFDVLKWQGTLNLTSLKNTSVGFLPSSSTGINNIFLTDLY